MKYVVTGGAGFIGTNLVNYLLEFDDTSLVVIIDNLSTGKIENICNDKRVKFIECSVFDIELYDEEIIDADVIVHLAATASVSISINNPLFTLSNNVENTIKLFMAIKEKNPDLKVIQASSAAVYGDLDGAVALETCELNPLSPYAIEKVTIEKYAKYFNNNYNMNITSLRFFNVYGQYQRSDSDYSGVISIFSHAISSERDITIYGDGLNTRDFVYVKDVVRAIKICSEDNINSVYNVGYGKSYTLNELVEIIKRNFNSNIKVNYKNEKSGDIRFSKSDVSKIKNNINFDCNYDLESGLSEYYGKEF